MRRSLAIALTIMLVLAATCLSAPVVMSADNNELVFGLIPEENIFRQMKRHEPLAEYLSEELGVPVRFTILSRYPHIITRFASRGLDGAFFGAFTGILAEETLDVEPIARPVNMNGNTTTQSYVFVRRGSGIKDMLQMRNRNIAFVDQATATGFLFAIDVLRRKGVRDHKQFFKEEIYTGGHDTAVYTVLAGRAEMGVAKSRILDKLKDKDPLVRDEIEIIYSSPALPDNTLCVRSDLPEDLKLKLKNILLSMHKDERGKEVLRKYEAQQFTLARMDDFEPVRSMARRAGIDLSKFEYSY